MGGEHILVGIRVVAYHGEHVILLRGEDSDDPVPEVYVGVPGTILRQDDTEEVAVARALECLGTRGSALSTHFVDRLFIPADERANRDGELVLIYTCDFQGYFSGTGAKPDKLPENFFPLHADIVRKVVEWRKKREDLRGRLEKLIKDLAGPKERSGIA